MPLPSVILQETGGGLAIATVDTGASAIEQRAHLDNLSINGLFETRTLTAEPRATLNGLFLGPLHITFGAFSPRLLRRTRKLCASDRFDGVGLQLIRTHGWHGKVGSRTIAGEAGGLVLFDFAQSFSLTSEIDGSFVNVMIPRSLASRLADDPRRLHGRALDAALGGPLASFLTGLVEHVAAIRSEQGPALAEILIALAVLGFRTDDDAGPEHRGAEGSLRDRVERLVAMRLNASDLSPDWIARKLGVSRTDLYAACNGSGGVARLIWDRRLAAARAVLLDPDESRTIGAIAHMFGFASDAHFSRAFKAQFGITPTVARRTAEN